MSAPAVLPLEEFGRTTLNAAGVGRVEIRPLTLRQTWLITGLAVSVSTDVSEPTCSVWASSKAVLLGSTATGSMDQLGLAYTLRGGFLIVEWAGGDPGATALATVYGTMTLSRG